MIQHHPSDDILVEYTAGSLPSQPALCVGVHLRYCKRCRQQVQKLTQLGGELLRELPGTEVSDALFERIFAEVNHPYGGFSRLPPAPAKTVDDMLYHWLPQGLAKVTWRKRWSKLYDHALDAPRKGRWRLSLQKITAGGLAPMHSHHASEWTVVLQGGFSDELGSYGRGDFILRDSDHTHRPRALEQEDCITLTYLEGPVRLVGPIGRWVEAFRDLFVEDQVVTAS